MPSIMMNLSFVAFVFLSAAALSSFYLQIAFSSNICASKLNNYTKFQIISINTSIPSLANITKMVDTILLQEKRRREEKAKTKKRVKETRSEYVNLGRGGDRMQNNQTRGRVSPTGRNKVMMTSQTLMINNHSFLHQRWRSATK